MLVFRVLGSETVQVYERSTEILLDCGSDRGRENVLALNGWGGQGAKLKVATAEKRMSGSKIFQWVANRLQSKERGEKYECGEVRALEVQQKRKYRYRKSIAHRITHPTQ